jgi:hypothetical protein
MMKLKIGIRQEAEHRSFPPQRHFTPQAVVLRFDFGRCRMRGDPLLFRAPIFLDDFVDLVPVVQVESDRAFDLSQG